MKISKIKLIESKSERLSIYLSAKIEENGNLVLEGQDLGEFVEERYGDGDYEYSLTVKAEYKDTILLNLIKERFADDSKFRDWLDEKQIPCEFWSF
jgi:hypothetical protein